MYGRFSKIIKSFKKTVDKLARLEAEVRDKRARNQDSILALEAENTGLGVLADRVGLVKNNLEKLIGA